MTTWEDPPADEKYVTFNRQALLEFLGTIPAYQEMIIDAVHRLTLGDAVVIRRQDKFASPCLATYAAMIGLVAMEHPDPSVKTDLLNIADYFEGQAKLAAEEGYKLPDR